MLSSLLVLMMLASVAQAGEPFLGLDLAASDATNRNFRAHVHGGAAANPYAGYMFNEYFGVQGQLQLIWHRPDNDQRGFEDENQETTWFGAGIGPRLNVPLDITGVCDRFFFCQPDLIDLYFVAQGAHFTGLSGRVSQSAAGFSVGGGLDFKLTRNWAVSANARWSRAYMQPRPQDLGPIQIQNERFGEDIRWATAGVGIKYTFAEPEQAPPPPPPVVAEPEPAPTPRLRRRIVLRAVHFDFDKSNIRPDAVPVLDEAVRILKEESEIVVTVEGHTDWIGTEEYNQGLSERRANAVRNYLVGHGIDPARLRTQGFGELRPVATNETVDGRAQNRRVELRVE
jgi:outer membrane protein OmpA-like peptidoglycan-associated protein